MMKLYDFTLSGNCYKVRLFLGLIDQSAELVPVKLLEGEQRQPAFLAINPRGQVPTLEDGNVRLGDSQAILVYLARRYADTAWFPQDAITQGRIANWLSFAANEIHHGPATARAAKLFGRPVDGTAAVQRASRALRQLEQHLGRYSWLAETEMPTVADVAVYPNVALADEGGIDLTGFPAIQAWFARIRALPGYTGMPGPDGR